MESQFDVLVVGELNVDLILSGLASLPKVGRETLASTMTLTLGSSSAIFASNLSAIGAKVAFLGMIGQDMFGELVVRSLREKKVNTDLVLTTSEFTTGATICLARDEDRANITYMGAMERLTINDITPECLRAARHLHFASAFLQSGLRADLATLFCRAKAVGLTTSFDAQWDPEETWNLDLRAILPNVDVFLPNEQEVLHLTGKRDVASALETMRPYAHTVVVKQGNKGATVMTGGRIFTREAFLNTNVVDTIGAGDSFDAGFVFRFISGASPKDCLTFGNLMGAVSTTAAGGTGAFSDIDRIMAIAKERFGYAG